ncbi:hypothetical protein JQS43_22150 [Natronosporangium hydrolyticum]|uniref:Uncharacterized protein n=1 Tax=Natronosporangium hydrolyticum TaxID=2811111 RepID=A0A895YFG0_9ACTN|nr:hypothetical protein [Natronosporangium hydrolyticum]QSB14189.1 hypothetical protein JQS43_22150 [Natronosporangium hydrolyticum]
MALVDAAEGEVPPIPPAALNDDPRSMFGWMRRQPGPEVRWEWPAVMQRVAEDKPLRDAAARVERQRTGPLKSS